MGARVAQGAQAHLRSSPGRECDHPQHLQPQLRLYLELLPWGMAAWAVIADPLPVSY